MSPWGVVMERARVNRRGLSSGGGQARFVEWGRNGSDRHGLSSGRGEAGSGRERLVEWERSGEDGRGKSSGPGKDRLVGTAREGGAGFGLSSGRGQGRGGWSNIRIGGVGDASSYGSLIARRSLARSTSPRIFSTPSTSALRAVRSVHCAFAASAITCCSVGPRSFFMPAWYMLDASTPRSLFATGDLTQTGRLG